MRTIICKRCGSPIDASQGECPVCGAVYYILPEDDGAEEREGTKVWERDEADEIYRAIERESADTDEPTQLFTAQPAPPPKAQPPEKREAHPAKREQPVLQAHGANERLPSRTWVYAAAAAAMLAVLTLVLCFMTGVFDFGAKSGDMPSLVGLNKDVAVDQLRAIDISPTVIYEESTEPEDTVIRQSPEEGAAIGSQGVTLWVSSGAAEETPGVETEYVEVPQLIGLTYERAAAQLAALGLTAVRGEDEFSSAPEGEVVRQSPLSGAKVQPGGTVTLNVSKGEEESEFTVVLTAGKGGTVSPSGSVSVEAGGSITIAAIPDQGYELRELRIDGVSVGAVGEYTIENVRESHSVYAVFAAVAAPPEPSASPSAPPESEAPWVSPSDIG